MSVLYSYFFLGLQIAICFVLSCDLLLFSDVFSCDLLLFSM